jgi:hypothetical protein
MFAHVCLGYDSLEAFAMTKESYMNIAEVAKLRRAFKLCQEDASITTEIPDSIKDDEFRMPKMPSLASASLSFLIASIFLLPYSS